MSTDLKMMPEDKYRRIALIHEAFTPGTPISSRDLFAGRNKQIQQVFGAVLPPGQHAVIYGERGVGKTSLAAIIYDLMVLAGKHEFVVARTNCSAGMTFEEIWRAIFKQLEVSRDNNVFTLDEMLPENPNPEQIRETLCHLDNPALIIIDEFDRVDQETAAITADTIKTLSDRATDCTLVLVGVADSVDQLIEEHESILRCLVQIPMPRMSQPELLEIIDNGLKKAEMTIESDVRSSLAGLSQGLPHYTHLLTMHAALLAVDGGRTHITQEDRMGAIKEAVDNQSQTMLNSYQKAIRSTRRNIFREVLLACALATDEHGYFSPADIRDPLEKIVGKRLEIPAFARHLKEFCDKSRGPILVRRGEARRFQYKFFYPLMQPFVIMKSIADSLYSGG